MEPSKKQDFYREFTSVVRKDLMEHNLSKKISDQVLIHGHNFGFHDEEINEIVEKCYRELVGLKLY